MVCQLVVTYGHLRGDSDAKLMWFEKLAAFLMRDDSLSICYGGPILHSKRNNCTSSVDSAARSVYLPAVCRVEAKRLLASQWLALPQPGQRACRPERQTVGLDASIPLSQ